MQVGQTKDSPMRRTCMGMYTLSYDANSKLFQVSFANIVNSKKAIRNRGWNPLNYNLLDDPELNNTQEKDAVNDANNH